MMRIWYIFALSCKNYIWMMALWAQTLFYFLMADTALCYIHFTSIRACSHEGVYIKHTATTYIMVGTMVQLLCNSVLCCYWYSQNWLSSEFSSVSRLTGRARQLEHGRGLDVFACAYSDGKNSIWKQNKMRREQKKMEVLLKCNVWHPPT